MTAALRVITAGELSGDTAQSSGMRRSAAISGAQAGAGGTVDGADRDGTGRPVR